MRWWQSQPTVRVRLTSVNWNQLCETRYLVHWRNTKTVTSPRLPGAKNPFRMFPWAKSFLKFKKMKRMAVMLPPPSATPSPRRAKRLRNCAKWCATRCGVTSATAFPEKCLHSHGLISCGTKFWRRENYLSGNCNREINEPRERNSRSRISRWKFFNVFQFDLSPKEIVGLCLLCWLFHVQLPFYQHRIWTLCVLQLRRQELKC